LTDWYSPAYLAGGPIQSIQNIIDYLSNEMHVLVYTSAYDLGKSEKMDDIQTNTWVNKSLTLMIYYQALKFPRTNVFKSIIRKTNPDIVYLNSMFSKHYVLDFLRFNRHINSRCNVVLAPRGMLKQSALEKKRLKKWIFLRFAKLIGLYNGVQFHATNEEEKNEIQRYFPNAKVFVIQNLPPPILAHPQVLNKWDFHIKLCFVGRIHPIKNLLFLLELLRWVKCGVSLSIVGHEEDKNYAMSCHRLVESLPTNITAVFLGGLSHDSINDILAEHHLFILPTLGENYGHAIIESLSIGRPVIISDQTPWKNLKQYNAGWELPLFDKQSWIDAIEEAASWGQAAFDRHCQGALDYARAHTNVQELVEKYKEMFGG
jgi:glycosyltransferase involved in cell wall biosynthesis